jgi:3-dehydroquinate synthase
MAVDKKVQDGKMRLVLMRALGESVITDQVSPAEIAKMLDRHLAAVSS